MNGIRQCAGATLIACSALAGALVMGCGNDQAQATRVETSTDDAELPPTADAVREPDAVHVDSDAAESGDGERGASGDNAGPSNTDDSAEDELGYPAGREGLAEALPQSCHESACAWRCRRSRAFA